MDTHDHPADGGVDTDLFGWSESNLPENPCLNYERCGNQVPENGAICGQCLDRVRRKDREER